MMQVPRDMAFEEESVDVLPVLEQYRLIFSTCKAAREAATITQLPQSPALAQMQLLHFNMGRSQPAPATTAPTTPTTPTHQHPMTCSWCT